MELDPVAAAFTFASAREHGIITAHLRADRCHIVIAIWKRLREHHEPNLEMGNTPGDRRLVAQPDEVCLVPGKSVKKLRLEAPRSGSRIIARRRQRTRVCTPR